MRTLCLLGLVVAAAFSAGCTAFRGKSPQLYLTPQRVERGLVVVLTGIEGHSRFNEQIVNGLAKGDVRYAIENVDWTSSRIWLANLESQDRNRRKAAQIAERLVRYKWAYPDRPVILVGQSGGGAMAVWIAESMQGEKVDGIILLAATLSPQYRLDRALANTTRGIVSFHSERDVLMLGLGTKIFRTMDGAHAQSAGRVGFNVPSKRPACYDKFFQVPWNSSMSGTGNHGLHLTSGGDTFVSKYIAPLVLSYQWNSSFVTSVSTGASGAKTQSAPAETDSDGRQRIR